MDRYALIGRRLGHSYSADMFNQKFATEGIDAVYELRPLGNIGELPAMLKSEPELRGFNVTVPYKEAVIAYLDRLTPLARTVGAVNTVRIDREVGETVLTGHNTDVEGFRDSLSSVPELKREGYALVLGSGGASKAVSAGLTELGISPIIVSRQSGNDRISYQELTPELVYGATAIVNTTPLGTSPEVMKAPPFPFQYLNPLTICMDLIYNPETTLFMRICSAHGCITLNGMEMLRLQARGAWRFWSPEA